jgi:4a-hydroxytetrahydrobiopterin dehydratase
MPDYTLIDDAALQAWLKDPAPWSLVDGEITAEFKFKNFIEAFGFMTQVAILMEKHNHHPRIENVYNKVRLSMNTHDAGNNITDRDLKLAEEISASWKS